MRLLEFVELSQQLARASGALGLTPVSFKGSPLDGKRSCRKGNDGSLLVYVFGTGRSRTEVATDMIDGICFANSVSPEKASAVREALWEAVSGLAKAS